MDCNRWQQLKHFYRTFFELESWALGCVKACLYKTWPCYVYIYCCVYNLKKIFKKTC